MTDDGDDDLPGSPEPLPKKCGAPLQSWQDRYGEPRYCTHPANSNLPADDPTRDDHDYCWLHKGRYEIEMRAKEALQHGLFTESVDHHYDKLDGWERVLAYGCYESLLADSTFELAPEWQTTDITFDDAPVPTVPEDVRDGNTITLEVPHPTEYMDRALALWIGAMKSVQMVNAQSKILADGMEVESTEYADFTTSHVPSEEGGEPKTWQTIEEVKEHHLNLPLSRLVRDRKDLLQYGGVGIDEGTDDPEVAVEFGDLESELPDHPELLDESPASDLHDDVTNE